jgi:hypothetical protein
VVFQPPVVLTQAQLGADIRAGRSCPSGLARLGLVTERLERVVAVAKRACRGDVRAGEGGWVDLLEVAQNVA